MQIKAYQKVPVEVEISDKQRNEIVENTKLTNEYLLARLAQNVFRDYMMNVDWNPQTAMGRRLEMKDLERGMWLKQNSDYDIFSHNDLEFEDFVEMTTTEKDFFETVEALKNIIKTFELTK